ncbi:hypothetical protein CEXT_323231 [Caerostris extrusa]|uniref:Uncharacterized protein n=1 Tax=Caerostris extrusa TaxID=172846 RepID=A0AAV4N2I4_CAEEX|nr:hypothetical protein CEXT_323231 [Caerostris extrusa]
MVGQLFFFPCSMSLVAFQIYESMGPSKEMPCPACSGGEEELDNVKDLSGMRSSHCLCRWTGIMGRLFLTGIERGHQFGF